jgi:hypothetical protein
VIKKQVRHGWALPNGIGHGVVGLVGAEAVDSTALGSHHGASLEDHGPNVVL